MNHQLHSLMLANERDVVSARQRARSVAAALGFDHHDQIRLSHRADAMRDVNCRAVL